MYEKELIAEALETLGSLAGGRTIREVEIALGPGLDSGRATRAWETLTEGTPFELTHVTWEEASDLLRCVACGHEYAGESLDSCPYCGGDGVVIEPALPVSLGRWIVAA